MSRRKSKKPVADSIRMKPRNPVAVNPLLRKSAAHGKTRKADRRANKVSLRKLPFEQTACPQCVIDYWVVQALGSSGSLSTLSSAA